MDEFVDNKDESFETKREKLFNKYLARHYCYDIRVFDLDFSVADNNIQTSTFQVDLDNIAGDFTFEQKNVTVLMF